jgi:diguanylate cyclase (GGDEF)-like protein
MSWLIIGVSLAILVAYTAAVWRLARRRAGPADAGRSGDPRSEHQPLHDDLTKLPNRTLFRDRLERALARSVRRRNSCAVLSIDIDRFKLVTDSLGPAAGDGLLRDVAARLDSCLRPEDTVARSGGDEFLVLLESVRTPDEAVAVVDRITVALGPPFTADERELYLTASIGVAVGRGGRDRPEDVLQNADVAVHRAKDNGRARHEIFRQEMNPHPLERLGLETDLRRAVETMDFVLEYQPVVDLRSRRVVGAEALVRWEHPRRGRLEPLEFVPVAEETGLILPIGRWVLETACAQAAGWTQPLMLFVNLSGRELQQPRMRLVDEVASVLAASGLPPAGLCLELTESAVMQDVDAAVAAMGDLKRLGVELALDDFGTGYSSLSYLRRFPLDIVKVDRSFVAELSGGDGTAIVRALIEVCHALDARVLAEGVEDPEQVELLVELGCDYGQGDHFSPPVADAALRQVPSPASTAAPRAAPRGSPGWPASG